MTIENVPLFDLASPDTLTGQQLLDAITKGINPLTGEHDRNFHESLRDDVIWGWNKDTETPIGTFEFIREWNGGDQRPMGRVVRHVQTNQFVLVEGTYSSWDGSDYDEISIAEPYEFTETRYRAVLK